MSEDNRKEWRDYLRDISAVEGELAISSDRLRLAITNFFNEFNEKIRPSLSLELVAKNTFYQDRVSNYIRHFSLCVHNGLLSVRQTIEEDDTGKIQIYYSRPEDISRAALINMINGELHNSTTLTLFIREYLYAVRRANEVYKEVAEKAEETLTSLLK